METIKVNMTPCDDVQTIHASQDDNEAREWGFELHNNGEKIDSSSISDQLVFKAYEGGTEQILPENGSTPTTSPFLGDIKYPQGLLSDQEFLYRESPTEEDGLAKITDIKGNTLNWNQLVENGNFADTSKWNKNGNETVFTVNNNEATILTNITGGGLYNNINDYVPNHKYLYSIELKGETSHLLTIGLIPRTSVTITTSWAKYIGIIQPTNQTNNFAIYDPRSSGRDNVYARNVQLIDLTKMGLDISNPSDFTSLFPLPYYAYNQGTLLSFNGNGIKTKNANVMPKLVPGTYTVNNITARVDNDGYIYVSGNAYTSGTSITIPLEESFELKKGMYCHAFNNRAEASITPTFTSWYFSLTPINRIAQCPDSADGTVVTNIRLYISANIDPNIVLRPMMSYTNMVIDYVENLEPSTLSLPISTYFSNGMKSAGSVYDELTESKAITRIGSVDLGSLTWSYSSTRMRFTSYAIDNIRKPPLPTIIGNILSSRFTSTTANNTYLHNNDKQIAVDGDGSIHVNDFSYTDGTEFKSAMSGVYLYYELATPTETSFTTASLVTENAEIPLSNDDGVLIGKCTEQLSSESGFFDAKIKLTDSDGDVYSNKIQLHVERSPQ